MEQEDHEIILSSLRYCLASLHVMHLDWFALILISPEESYDSRLTISDESCQAASGKGSPCHE